MERDCLGHEERGIVRWVHLAMVLAAFSFLLVAAFSSNEFVWSKAVRVCSTKTENNPSSPDIQGNFLEAATIREAISKGQKTIAHAKTKREIREKWSIYSPKYNGPTFDVVPSITAPYSPGKVNSGFLQDGVNMINFARYLAGLPDDVQLVPERNEDGQYGAVLLAASDFSHTPSKPANMPQDFYDRGYASTSSSNLGGSYSNAAIFEQDCLFDSHNVNIDRLGHRRWLLNPVMLYTGIGHAPGYYTTYALDTRRHNINYNYVAWPSSGLFPGEMFEQSEAWSISLNPNVYEWDANGDFRVKLTRLSDGRSWILDRSNNDKNGSYFNANFDGYGVGNCFIFRPDPDSISYNGDDKFEVTLSGAIYNKSGARTSVTYRTRFMNLQGETSREHNYKEYLLVSNPETGTAGKTANVRVEFQKNDPADATYTTLQVRAGERRTLCVDEYAYAEDVSLKVSSDVPVVAERAMYFDAGQGRDDGSVAMGIPTLSKTWYLAEGYTGGQFDQYILLQNPGSNAVSYKLTLMREDGHNAEFTGTLEATSRKTIHVDELKGFENCSVSAKIEAGDKIAAERSMYFNYAGCTGGHVEHAISSPALDWYLAEGCTTNDSKSSFDTFILLQNPENKPARVEVEFQKQGGGVVPLNITVKANSRYTIPVDKLGGMEACSFSTHVSSNVPIITERSMYFSYHGLSGGSCSVGITEPGKDFSFAEGCTAFGFDTFLLLQNPSSKAVEVSVTYNPDPAYGGSFTKKYLVQPRSRYTVPVDSEIPNGEFGMQVHATQPIMAERAMYFDYQVNMSNTNHITGGHCTCGAPQTSNIWYFAEGYTGD